MIAKRIIKLLVVKTAIIQHFRVFVRSFIVFYLLRFFYLFFFIFSKSPAKKVFMTAKERVWILCKTNLCGLASAIRVPVAGSQLAGNREAERLHLFR